MLSWRCRCAGAINVNFEGEYIFFFFFSSLAHFMLARSLNLCSKLKTPLHKHQQGMAPRPSVTLKMAAFNDISEDPSLLGLARELRDTIYLDCSHDCDLDPSCLNAIVGDTTKSPGATRSHCTMASTTPPIASKLARICTCS